MPGHSSKSALLCLGVGGLLTLLPTGMTGLIRDVVRAGFVPGQKALLTVRDKAQSSVTTLLSRQLSEQQHEIEDLQSELADANRRERRARLIATNALQQVTELRQQPESIGVAATEPLFAARAIEARVIGRELLSLWKSKRLLDHGARDGVQEDQWVLDGNGMKLDQGEDASLVPGLMVFAGRSVLGRVSEAGKFVSSVELISDRGFRAKATVGRASGQGLSFSTAGLLEGDGGGMCRLTQIPASDTVAIGDGVYTVPEDSSVESPLLFGRVSSVTPGPLHWDVVVKPEANAASFRTVQVLTTSFNPQRLVGRSR